MEPCVLAFFVLLLTVSGGASLLDRRSSGTERSTQPGTTQGGLGICPVSVRSDTRPQTAFLGGLRRGVARAALTAAPGLRRRPVP